jgi:hypothetical protein
MMARVVRQFRGTVQLITDIQANRTKVFLNFDCADMGLRRRLDEMEVGQGEIASSCIKDDHCRELWDGLFGAGTGEVSWSEFCIKFVGSRVLNHRTPKFLSHLRGMLCFPETDTVTPYAVHIFSALYGPGLQMWTNYDSLVMGYGFVGLVNAVHAKEMFDAVRSKLHKPSYMLRYSRDFPGVFTVTTYDPATGEIAHVRNMNPTRSLPDLIFRMGRAGWNVALFSLNDAVAELSALSCAYLAAPLYTSHY